MRWLRHWRFRFLAKMTSCARSAPWPGMAVLLSAYFGTSGGFGINLQAHFDLEMAKDKGEKQVAGIKPQPHAAGGGMAARLK